MTLQDACHLAHAQGIRAAPRAILAAIPGVRLHEQATPDRCCGAAGLYATVQAEMSREVLDAKLADIASTGASTVVTSNPGCTMQIETGLRRARRPGEVLHLIELLDRSYAVGAAERART